MTIRVELYGTLRRFSTAGSPGIWIGEAPESASLANLVSIIGAPPREIAVISINGKTAPMDTVISPGDEIIMVTHFGAG